MTELSNLDQMIYLKLDQITSERTHYKIFRTRVTPSGLMSARPYEQFRPTLFGLVQSILETDSKEFSKSP